MTCCLIDADIIRYQVGFSAQFLSEDGETAVRDAEYACSLLDELVRDIEIACEADEPSVLYMTDDLYLNKLLNKRRKRGGLDLLPFVPNFRYDVATSRPYKERTGTKPFHYKNLTAHILDHYETKIVGGIEADDALCIDGYKNDNVVICSRDKDLRQVEGTHFSWECGKQREWGPFKVEGLGHIERKEKGGLFGYGPMFFYAQMITGDVVDSIPGLPRGGPALAEKLLKGCSTEQQMFRAVSEAYTEKLGDGWEDYFEEQARLLWMIREVDDNGLPKHWEWPTNSIPVGEG